MELAGFKLEECVTHNSETPLLCVIYKPVMEYNSSPATESSLSDYDNNEQWNGDEQEVLSDWDDINNELPKSPLDPPNGSSNNTKASEEALDIMYNVLTNLESSEIVNANSTEHKTSGCIEKNENEFITEIELTEDESNVFHENQVDMLPCSKEATMEKQLVNKKNLVHSKKEMKQNIVESINLTNVSDLKNLHSQKDFKNSKTAVGTKYTVNNAKSDINTTKDVVKNTFAKENKEPVAGTSNIKKRKKNKKLEDELTKEDIKGITQCIVINTLNKIDDTQDIIEDQLAEVDATVQFEDVISSYMDVNKSNCNVEKYVNAEKLVDNKNVG